MLLLTLTLTLTPINPKPELPIIRNSWVAADRSPSRGGRGKARRTAARGQKGWRSRPQAKKEVEFLVEIAAIPLPTSYKVNDFSLFWPLEKASPEQKVSTLNKLASTQVWSWQVGPVILITNNYRQILFTDNIKEILKHRQNIKNYLPTNTDNKMDKYRLITTDKIPTNTIYRQQNLHVCNGF